MKNWLKHISLNHNITPILLKTAYWSAAVVFLCFILISSLSIGKKIVFLAVGLIPSKILLECFLIFFQLLESQQQTNRLLTDIHNKLN
ncbi:MAG: hypothetical protein CMF46_05260 [Legionellales bacterium]|nr:hypothetical protein [Legionellales bacterium]